MAKDKLPSGIGPRTAVFLRERYAGSAVRSSQGQPRFYRGDHFVSDNVESLTFPCILRE